MATKTFREIQKFDQKWLWIVIGILILIPVCLTFFYKKGVIISILAAIPVVLILVLMRLKTEINEKGISVRFFPIHIKEKLIPWKDLKEVYIREYFPVKEFGGWGVRISLKHGMAYNVKGRTGIQLVFRNGKKLLIGTQNPQEADTVIREYFPIEKR